MQLKTSGRRAGLTIGVLGRGTARPKGANTTPNPSRPNHPAKFGRSPGTIVASQSATTAGDLAASSQAALDVWLSRLAISGTAEVTARGGFDADGARGVRPACCVGRIAVIARSRGDRRISMLLSDFAAMSSEAVLCRWQLRSCYYG